MYHDNYIFVFKRIKSRRPLYSIQKDGGTFSKPECPFESKTIVSWLSRVSLSSEHRQRIESDCSKASLKRLKVKPFAIFSETNT